MRLLPKYPLESLLRTPVELLSAAGLGLLTVAIVWSPGTFLVDQQIGYVVGVVLVSIAGYRMLQGIHLLRYQRNIKCNRPKFVDFRSIPNSTSSLFIGRGFVWTSKHTQRLHETQSHSGRKYLDSQGGKSALGDSDAVSLSGRPEIHGVELSETSVSMNRADRVGHTLVLGTTRVGKTRLSELLIAQDIQRGEVVIVFDPKGDAELMCRVGAASGRELVNAVSRTEQSSR